MSTTEPIRNKKHIKALVDYYRDIGQVRNFVLIVLGLYSILRISDLLHLRWKDVYDFKNQQFYNHIYLIEGKTQKPKIIAVNQNVIKALKMYFSILPACTSETWLFPNNRKEAQPISRIQAYRIIKKAVTHLGLNGCISCHSLRKTLGYHSWRAGKSPEVIMDIYNHSSFNTTKRYLGIVQDDIDEIYLNVDF